MKVRNPLWLPEGSIRAIIALAFTAATIGAVFASLGGDTVSGPVAALFAVTTQIVNAYFNDNRRRSSDPPAVTPPSG